jgi:Phr family secreted Rap phosphatase inhibitor
MKKIKYLLLALAVTGISSCGIFKKDCNCPHFSRNISPVKTAKPVKYV